MKTKPPADRRVFLSAGDEVCHLYDKVIYWLYQRESKVRARPFAKRLARLLQKVDREQGAIFYQECRSLICEVKEDLPGFLIYIFCKRIKSY